MRHSTIQNKTKPLASPLRAGRCDSFITRLRGYMFRSNVEPGEALLFVQPNENRLDAAIHMFFVPFSLGVIWMDSAGQVVDTCLAKPWRPFYMPAHAARFILETHPDLLAMFQPGDQVSIDHA